MRLLLRNEAKHQHIQLDVRQGLTVAQHAQHQGVKQRTYSIHHRLERRPARKFEETVVDGPERNQDLGRHCIAILAHHLGHEKATRLLHAGEVRAAQRLQRDRAHILARILPKMTILPRTPTNNGDAASISNFTFFFVFFMSNAGGSTLAALSPLATDDSQKS